VLLLILGAFYTFTGVSGFLEEKRSGALELLLVTPVSAGRIIFGRAWGLWKQFLPAGLVLAAFYTESQWRMQAAGEILMEAVRLAVIVACGFLTLPVFATYFALRVKSLPGATVLTWVALCVPVLFAAAATDLFVESHRAQMGFMPPVVFLSNGAFALLACFLLRHSLSRRIYSF
jgi:ABC-type Na+ efflux pump permease subunit